MNASASASDLQSVVLSYADEDRPHAEQLATKLTLFGWEVWWDREILPGRSFRKEIAPGPAELPDDIRKLAYRNAMELSHTRWSEDVGRLVKALDMVMKRENT